MPHPSERLYCGITLRSVIFVDPPRDAANPMRNEAVWIPSGGLLMNGVMYAAAGIRNHPTVLNIHGTPGNEQNMDIAQTLHRAGYNVLSLRLIVIGHSYGGFAAARIAAGHPNIAAVVLLAPWNPAQDIPLFTVPPEKFAAAAHSIFDDDEGRMGGYTDVDMAKTHRRGRGTAGGPWGTPWRGGRVAGAGPVGAVGEGPVDDRGRDDHRDDPHRPLAPGAGQRVNLEDPAEHFGPPGAGRPRRPADRFDDRPRLGRPGGGALLLPSRAPGSTGVPAIGLPPAAKSAGHKLTAAWPARLRPWIDRAAKWLDTRPNNRVSLYVVVDMVRRRAFP